MGEWPLGNRAALSLTFDNLGEAAEVQLGAAPMPEGPFGEHFTAQKVVPYLLEEIGGRGLRATFFVEGINAGLYPDVLMTIALRRHEIGYHAWCHEDWASLSAAEQADNLERGLAALDGMSMGVTGMRPPGGRLGAGGLDAIRAAGYGYCSPAGEGLSHVDGLAVVPFQWRHVDASCVLPPLAAVRQRMTGSPDPIEPAAFVDFIGSEIDRLVDEGGHLTIVLHPAMVEEWLGRGLLALLLDRVDEAAKFEDVWVAPCGKIAEHVLANPEVFGGVTALDQTSWSDAAA